MKDCYSESLTNTLFQWRLAHNAIETHRADAIRFYDHPDRYWLENSKQHLQEAIMRSARLWRRFCRMVKQSDGFVVIGKHGYVYIESNPTIDTADSSIYETY